MDVKMIKRGFFAKQHAELLVKESIACLSVNAEIWFRYAWMVLSSRFEPAKRDRIS